MPTACFPLSAAALRRWGSAIMLVSYFWVTGVFPVAHAAAEAPQAGVVTESGDAPDQLPVGHDHLTCHFCAPGGTLVASPSDHPAPIHAFQVRPISPAPLNLPSTTLAWSHHAIPSRAPPALIA
ncbi:MAG TPA: hypothetical protein VMK53_11015 [Gemmatimonadales bacterium]|nr:hypothetical protein [Gemmatimonadales bacterium]